MSAGAGRYRMLVVDDQIDNLDLLERLFKGEFDVHRASDPLRALELLREGPFEVIITDQRMPGMSGIELLQRSLELAPEAIRIGLTAYPDVDVGIGGEHDANGLGRQLQRALQELDAAHAGHALVGDDDLERPLAQQLERAQRIAGAMNVELALEQALQEVEVVDLIVDHQHPVAPRARGHSPTISGMEPGPSRIQKR